MGTASYVGMAHDQKYLYAMLMYEQQYNGTDMHSTPSHLELLAQVQVLQRDLQVDEDVMTLGRLLFLLPTLPTEEA